MKQQFGCPCKILIGRKLEIFYKYIVYLLCSFPTSLLRNCPRVT